MLPAESHLAFNKEHNILDALQNLVEDVLVHLQVQAVILRHDPPAWQKAKLIAKICQLRLFTYSPHHRLLDLKRDFSSGKGLLNLRLDNLTIYKSHCP